MAFPFRRRLSLVSAGSEELERHPRRTRTRRLHLSNLKAQDLRGLREWERLTDVHVDLGRLRSLDGIEGLARLRTLRLSLGWNRDASLDIDPIGLVPSIETLAIGIADPVGAFAPIGSLSNLRHLSIFYRDQETAPRIREIALESLTQLEALSWQQGEWPFGPVSVHELTRAKNLRRLDVGGTHLTGRLEALLELPMLESLTVSNASGRERDALQGRRPGLSVQIIPAPPPTKPPDLVLGIVQIRRLPGLDDWSIFEDLSRPLGARSNVEAERRIIAAVRRSDPALLGRLIFDSEADYASISTTAEEDIRRVAEIVNALANHRQVNPSDGDINVAVRPPHL